MSTHADLVFGSLFQDALPADPLAENRTRQVFSACYSLVQPKVAPAPRLLAYSREVASELGFSAEFCLSPLFTETFVGNTQLPGMKPYAMCYGGHQFGQWAGQLGDGRAINLGERVCEGRVPQVLQLKGAGPTPYSRSADGLAVLRSSIREFLCSEAMHHLGVPTTRALSLIATGEPVQRDMFYNGNPEWEPGAVVARVAPSFVRFGNFEIFAARGDMATLESLLAFVLQQHYPEIFTLYAADKKAAMLQFFAEVCARSCDLVVEWMRVGFVHGVLNTDNMSILGLTIDYGPYGWLDNFDPTWTPNTTDSQRRRYRYENQPAIVQWNLLQLANALYPLIESADELEHILRDFRTHYDAKWREMMAHKLGLNPLLPAVDAAFLLELEKLLVLSSIDFSLFYRQLIGFTGNLIGNESPSPESLLNFLLPLSYQPQIGDEALPRWLGWFKRYGDLLRADDYHANEGQARMRRTNPVFILRNYLAQEAIDAAYQQDYSKIQRLLEALQEPYAEDKRFADLVAKRPEWARNRAGCSMLSCSS